MDILLDQHISNETRDILKKSGHSMMTLRELGRSEARNGEAMALAKSRNSILVTEDSDFTSLVLFPLGSHSGIIFIKRVRGMREQSNRVLIELLSKHSRDDLRGGLAIVHPDQYTLQKP